ncbi:MAG: aspartate 1-decarboxylase [Proteiniphilum sp.]|nr:aspartate 1-decarboxylase [Proteiniphilum sp.]
MQLTMLKCKLHRATVTEANLNYTGSITIDKTLLEKANLLVWEQVHIVNVNNGARFETYVIEGEADSGVICLNGAAARLVQPGDEVIIMAYAQLSPDEVKNHEPLVYILNKDNKIEQQIIGKTIYK